MLYPAPLRDLPLHLALTDLFPARWTERIHDEWIRSVLADRADITAAQLARTRSLMNSAVPDALIGGYEGLIAHVTLPDANDRHVLAAAIRAYAGVIVTYNIKDFPPDPLHPYGIEAQHPDEFVMYRLDLSPGAVYAVVRDQRQMLKNPPRSVRALLDTFLLLGLASAVAALEPMHDLL